MKILEVLNDPKLKNIREEVNNFSADMLEGYNKEVKRKLTLFRPKVIHDAVWKTIEINRLEVIIIDSPIIQRLRKIKHLGLAEFLFPGAVHSRFEHTLGVLCLADQISKKVEKSLPKTQMQEDDNTDVYDFRQIVRLAAIFHDCGHFFLSHASERFFESRCYSRYKEIKSIKNIMIGKDEIGKTDIKLSEIISVLIVTSPALVKLLEIAWPYRINDNQSKKISGYIASLILGVPVDLKQLPFSTIISGPIDVDKIDFIKQQLNKLDLTVEIFQAKDFPPKLFSKEDISPFKSKKRKELVLNAFKKIGEELLRYSKKDKPNWDEKRIKNSVLGYNNAQQCLILPWNTPTYTLTPLWFKGNIDKNSAWTPLFPRQSK